MNFVIGLLCICATVSKSCDNSSKSSSILHEGGIIVSVVHYLVVCLHLVHSFRESCKYHSVVTNVPALYP